MDGIWLKTSRFLREVEQSIKEDVSQYTPLNSLPIASIFTLAVLYEKDDQKASDIAKAISVATTSFTPTLDRLENAGLIKRSAHPIDRRAVTISLTKEGKKLQTIVMNAIGNAEVRYGGK